MGVGQVCGMELVFSSSHSQLYFSWGILSSTNTEDVALTELFLDVKLFQVTWEDFWKVVDYTESVVCSYPEVLMLYS